MATDFFPIQRSSSLINPNLTFVHISTASQVESIFQARMQDLSMSRQNKLNNLIETIKKGNRICELFLDSDNPVGVIVYKQKIKNNNFAVKTFSLIDKNNIQKEYSASLLNRIIEIAKEKKAEDICFKLNQYEDETISFFRDKNIKEINSKAVDIKCYVLNLQDFISKQNGINDESKESGVNVGEKRKRNQEGDFERILRLKNLAVYLQLI